MGTLLACPPARSSSRALGIGLGNEADHRPLLLPTVCWLASLITLRDLPLHRKRMVATVAEMAFMK